MKLVPFTAALGAACVLGTTVQIGAQTGAMPSMNPMVGMSHPLTVPMHELNGSGEGGAAVLRDTAKGLLVTIHVKNAKGPQPVHIHKGSCAALDPKPEYALHNIVNGTSITTVPGVTIARLGGKAAINVHKSLTDIPTYVSCGDIMT